MDRRGVLVHPTAKGVAGLLGPAVAAGLLAVYQLAALPVALAAAAGYFALALRWPNAALTAVVLALPFYQLLRPLHGSWGFSAAETGVALCALAAGGRLLLAGFATGRWKAVGELSRLLSSRPTFFDVGAIAFVFLGVASLAVSVKPWESLRMLRTVILEPVALYFLVVYLGGGRHGVRRLAGAVVVSAVVISAVGLYQYATNQNIITAEESLRRIRGFYGSPNHLGLYLGRAAPLALCLWAFGATGRWIYALALAPITTALLLTFSLGAWLGVAAAVVFAVALWSRRGLLVCLSGLGVLAAMATPLLAGLGRFRSHLDFAEGTTFHRLQVWQSALAMVRDHPVLGIGLDNFLYYYRDLGYMLPTGWREPNLSHPHNLVLDFWLSLGLAGLVVAAVLMVRLFGLGLAIYRGEAEPWARGLALGVMASMVDFAAHGLIDNSYFLVDLAMLFWLSFAILRVLRATAATGNPVGASAVAPEEARR